MSNTRYSKKNGKEIVETDLNPSEILHNPILNKGTGFTDEERHDLGLHGLLPLHVSSIDAQVKRRYHNFCLKADDIAKYKFLRALQDRNETLFYRLVCDHADEMMPYIYTPTVGSASVNYSYLYNQNRGVYISYPLRDKIDEIVNNIPQDEVDVIVVTDGGRILGLGDLGVGGMAIPVGKLSLYTAFGGIHPRKTLPIILDLGTNNPTLLNDELYLGWQHARVTGEDHEAFIAEFVRAITKRYPNVLIQWEDFKKEIAQPLLDKYRDRICSFNDDIQGTAAVTMAGLLAAVHKAEKPLTEMKLVIYGGGSAGVGISDLCVQYMMQEGVSKEEAKNKIHILDSRGLIHTKREGLSNEKARYARDYDSVSSWNADAEGKIPLFEVVKNVQPDILIGVAAQPSSFTEDIVKEMAKHSKHPIIFPLSNPTHKAEAAPADLIHWTDGKALIATGSPFADVHHNDETFTIGQCNNVFIFPGVGLGAIAAKSTQVTDTMFLKAAEVLSTYSPIVKESHASLFPKLTGLRAISRHIAIEVAKIAVEEGHAGISLDEIEVSVDAHIWEPVYPNIKRKA